jgi:hypothetical protein
MIRRRNAGLGQEYRAMLKLIWTPGAAAAPDSGIYQRATDTLVASFGNHVGTAEFPRDPALAPAGLNQLADVLHAWLAARAVPNTPVKLMLHGYAHDPRHAGDVAFDPFALIYAYPGATVKQRLSWLPLVEECDADGSRRQETAIAFGWVSTGSRAEYGAAGWSESYQYACIDLAPLAARALAAVLRALDAENVEVDVLAHSLGTRLFTMAVAVLGTDDRMLNDVILLNGAEFSVDAAATFAGRQFNVINVTNEVDAVLTTGGEQFGDPARPPGSTPCCNIGRYGLGKPESWAGIAEYPRNWVDIAVDRRDVQVWFKSHGGYLLTPTASDDVHPEGFMNHWASYTELGNRAWLIDLLWKPGLNGGTLATAVGLPRGVLRDLQPVFAGVGIPTTTPMTAMARLAFQTAAGFGS